jgi:hypothetical protein
MKNSNKLIIIALISFIVFPYNTISQESKAINKPFKKDYLNEVIPGHNILNSKDRINLVFTTVDDDDKFKQYLFDNLSNIIGWNGKYFFQDTDNRVDIAYNFFAIDPIRKYKNRFNIWYVPNGERIYDTKQVYNKLENHVEITINNNYNYTEGRSSLWERNIGKSIETPSQDVKNSKMKATIDLNLNLQAINSVNYIGKTLTHELGHALFKFRDEYFNEEYLYKRDAVKPTDISQELMTQEINVGSNCAVNNEEGRSKWDKHIGSVDSMIKEMNIDYGYAGLTKKINIEDSEIGYYPVKYCVAGVSNSAIDKLGIVVPTKNSIMTVGNKSVSAWGNPAKEYINNFFTTTIKGEGEPIPYVEKYLSKLEATELAATSYTEKYSELAKNYGGSFNQAYSNEELSRQGAEYIANANPLDIETTDQSISYFGVRKALLKLLNLHRTPLYAGTVPVVNVRYGNFGNRFLLVFFDFIILVVLLELLYWTYKLVRKIQKR